MQPGCGGPAAGCEVVGQVTSSGSDSPQIFPIFLSFSYFSITTGAGYTCLPWSCSKAEMPNLSLGCYTVFWGAWGTGTAQPGPTAALKLSPAPQDPVSLKRVGIKVQWDFPGASQLALSCSAPQKASSKGSLQSFSSKAHPKRLCPLPHAPKELRDPFRSCRDRSAPSHPSSCMGPCLRGGSLPSLEIRPRAQRLHREREKRLRGGRKPGKQSMQGRRRRCLLPQGNLHPVAVHTSLWKRSVTFTWEKLGDFISGFWCVLASGRERKAHMLGSDSCSGCCLYITLPEKGCCDP